MCNKANIHNSSKIKGSKAIPGQKGAFGHACKTLF
jgi:hypothetical protein